MGRDIIWYLAVITASNFIFLFYKKIFVIINNPKTNTGCVNVC